MTFYAHWTKVDIKGWPWKNFSPKEIACKGTGQLRVNKNGLDALQNLRNKIDRPIILTSAYRSPEHNRNVGGAKASKHLEGHAFDVRMDNHDPREFESAARSVGFKGFGYYPRSGFMHIDLGPERTWGTPFPADQPMKKVEEEAVKEEPEFTEEEKPKGQGTIEIIMAFLKALFRR